MKWVNIFLIQKEIKFEHDKLSKGLFQQNINKFKTAKAQISTEALKYLSKCLSFAFLFLKFTISSLL